jgi:hypothetical protein
MDRKQTERLANDTNIDRRGFVASAAGAAIAATALPLVGNSAFAAPTRKSAAETAVKELYSSLSKEQRPIVALPLDDKRRTQINPNWHITKATIGKFFNAAQQDLITKIFKGMTSEDGFERFQKQMADDSGGGLKAYSIALFGDPNDGPFEFELTGRHHTSRADGNSLEGMAFGGPIVYGHSKKGNTPQNLFSYQTTSANEVFEALDAKHREKALLAKAPGEGSVRLRDDVTQTPGLACSELSSDQKELVESTLKNILLPYRKEDVDEVMEMIKASGGLDEVRIAFYKNGDLDNDKVWDIWRLEGPSIVCHFRGAPHVHAYINVAQRKTK